MIYNVKTPNGAYEVVIEKGCLENVSNLIDINRKVMIVTDSGVPKEYCDTILKQCSSGFIYSFSCGEKSKNIDTACDILRVLLKNKFSRIDCVVAVGGGVVGDIAGFVSSIYMRGIDFYNIPTTLLSQVDSSVGGKTAIDFSGIKNSVGTFYYPKKVIIDPNVLSTLDKRQISSGLAECIKMATTCDEDFFNMLESKDGYDNIEEVIFRAVGIKHSIVERDPEEKGLRMVLNFGHTIGHSIESISNGNLLHGECVAIGMTYMCSDRVKERLIAVLKKYDLPYKTNIPKEQFKEYISRDKKVRNNKIVAVYVDKIGSFEFRNIETANL